jgi:hypothetical protein
MSTGAIVGAVVVMVCCSASSAAAMMMGGSEEPKVEPKAEPEAEPEAEPKVEPEDPDEKVCSRNVSAKRLDAPHGWGMNLHFKCGESTAQIGNSSTNVKTTPQPINIAKLGCPKVVNKSNWSGTDTYPDKFEINVSDCLA